MRATTFELALLLFVLTGTYASAGTPSGGPSPLPDGQLIKVLEERLQQYVTEEVKDNLREATTNLMDRAGQAIHEAQLVLDVVKGWITVVSLIFAFLLF